MRWDGKHFGLAALILLGGCVVPGAVKPTPYHLTFNIPHTAGQDIQYVWEGVTYPNQPAFMAQVDAQIAASMRRVTIQQASLGSLRMILPIRPALVVPSSGNPTGEAEAVSAYAAYERDLDDSRVAALRRSNIFSSIRVSTEQVSNPDNDGADFVLWFNEAHWQLRYLHGDTDSLDDMPDVAQWTNVVNNLAHSVQRDIGDHLRYKAHTVGTDKLRFYFDGKDYFEGAELGPPMKAAWLAAGSAVRPVPRPVGRRVKIVIPANPIIAKIPVPGTAAQSDELQAAQRAFYEATTAGYIAAIRAGRLFAEVDVVTQDVSDVPLESYDATIWHPVTSAFQWSFRLAGQKDARAFVWPASNLEPQDWVNAMASQMLNNP